jgi:hypothetical protein
MTLERIVGVSALLMTIVSDVPAMAAGHNLPETSQITVRVLDLVQIQSETLNRAKQVTEGVFSPIGVKISWRHCSAGERREDQACSAPTGSNDISLRIFQRGKTELNRMHHATTGMAVPLAPQRNTGIIYVFFDRVVEVAENDRIPLELVLGITTAHEIGHLFLLSQPHALAGIMRAILDQKDWRLAGQGHLGFTDCQRKIIRAGVQARSPRQDENPRDAVAFLSIPR